MNPLQGPYAFLIDCCNQDIETAKKKISWAKGMLIMNLSEFAIVVVSSELDAAKKELLKAESDRDALLKNHFNNLRKIEEQSA